MSHILNTQVGWTLHRRDTTLPLPSSCCSLAWSGALVFRHLQILGTWNRSTMLRESRKALWHGWRCGRAFAAGVACAQALHHRVMEYAEMVGTRLAFDMGARIQAGRKVPPGAAAGPVVPVTARPR